MMRNQIERILRRGVHAPLSPWTDKQRLADLDTGYIALSSAISADLYKFCEHCDRRVPTTSGNLCRWCDPEATWRLAA